MSGCGFLQLRFDSIRYYRDQARCRPQVRAAAMEAGGLTFGRNPALHRRAETGDALVQPA
jgi:hypothetical protein